MTFTFGDQATVDEDDQAAVYAELILASVCDSYEKTAAPLTPVSYTHLDVYKRQP